MDLTVINTGFRDTHPAFTAYFAQGFVDLPAGYVDFACEGEGATPEAALAALITEAKQGAHEYLIKAPTEPVDQPADPRDVVSDDFTMPPLPDFHFDDAPLAMPWPEDDGLLTGDHDFLVSA